MSSIFTGYTGKGILLLQILSRNFHLYSYCWAIYVFEGEKSQECTMKDFENEETTLKYSDNKPKFFIISKKSL